MEVNKNEMTEEELKAEIKDLEKRIKNKQAHIDKLAAELAEMVGEQRTYKERRVELLRQELEE